MALFEFTLTDADVGTSIGPSDGGYLVDLKQTRGASRYMTPAFDEGRQHWVSAYCQLRGALDHRDLVCVNPSQSAAWPGYIVNKSIPYLGALTIRCLPIGSEWSLALSDAPLTQREINERAEALRRKALEDHIIAVRGAKETARRARAVMDAARAPV
jgi:hypothetical protein